MKRLKQPTFIRKFSLLLIIFLFVLYIMFYETALGIALKDLGLTYYYNFLASFSSPDYLRVRSVNIDNSTLPNFSKNISKLSTVKKLYSDILQAEIVDNNYCSLLGYGNVRYSMNFYQKNQLIMHVIFNPNNCEYIYFDNGFIRMADGSSSLVTDLQKVLQLSDNTYYGPSSITLYFSK